MNGISISPDMASITIMFKKPFSVVPDTIGKLLQEVGFGIPPEGTKVIRVDALGNQVPALRLVKGDIDVVLCENPSIITCSGNNLGGLSQAADEVWKVCCSIPGDLRGDHLWTELLSDVRAKGTKKPFTILKTASSTPYDEAFRTALGNDLISLGCRYCRGDATEQSVPLNQGAEWFDIEMHPYVPNPDLYWFRVIGRSKDNEQVTKLCAGLTDRLRTIVSSMEASI